LITHTVAVKEKRAVAGHPFLLEESQWPAEKN
jgi:hypothetical protein